tara:strand:- start:491 stop:1537 length:1047 start_codon:yes stop_codon:yes gene_type:complete
MSVEINDVREIGEFKTTSFSGYKKSDVNKELLKSITEGKVEPACYWCAELICSANYVDLWNTIILYSTKYIHLGNPKLVSYLDLRIKNFKDVMESGYAGYELKLRNNSKIRKLFGEIIIIICKSQRKHPFEVVKIKKEEEFILSNMKEHFKAPNTKYGDLITKPEDPKELFIAVNELCYHLSKESLNSIKACYWIEWMLEYDVMCKKKKAKCECERRSYPVDVKEQKNIVWIIWDIFLHYSAKKSKFIDKLMNSLLKIFCLRFTSGVIRKRRFILYYAVNMITEHVNQSIQLIDNKDALEEILPKIDNIYKQIKKSEKSPQTDYLFNNIGKSNHDKTLEKLEMLKDIL